MLLLMSRRVMAQVLGALVCSSALTVALQAWSKRPWVAVGALSLGCIGVCNLRSALVQAFVKCHLFTPLFAVPCCCSAGPSLRDSI